MRVFIEGTVTGGNRVGRTLGFPTANLAVDPAAEIRDGVYAARVRIGGDLYEGMANVGRRPTVTEGRGRFLEVNVFGFDGDLYGERIEVCLLRFIREETAFASVEELRRQIGKDREKIKGLFEREEI